MQKRTAEGKKKKQAYDLEYLKKFVKVKSIPFNVKNPEDMEMFEWIKNQPESGNQYVKRLIREDMRRRMSDV